MFAQVDAVFFEKDTEPYAKTRDAEIYELCKANGVRGCESVRVRASSRDHMLIGAQAHR